MLVCSVIILIILVLTYLSKDSNGYHFFIISFIILFFFQAFRYGFGNDYLNYLRIFDEIKSLDLNHSQLKIFSEENKLELGFIYLIRLFPFNNFFIFIAFWSFFNCLVYYLIIKQFVPANYYWFALSIYLLYPAGMLIQLSAIRQTIAIWFLVWAFKYALNRKFIHYLIIMIIGGNIHSSCLLLIPLYFIIGKSFKNYYLYIFTGVFFLLFSLEYTLLNKFSFIIEDYFEQYTYTVSELSIEYLRDPSIAEIFIQTLIFVLILFSYKVGNNVERQYSIYAMFFIYFSLLVSIIFLIDRVAMYFIPFLVITLSNAVSKLKNKMVKLSSMFLILVYFIKQYLNLFTSDTWGKHFYDYQTIFSIN